MMKNLVVGLVHHNTLTLSDIVHPDQRVELCFKALPQTHSVQIRPPELVLPAGSLTELTLAYKPTGTEKQAIRLHVVDTQSRQLVGVYMIAVRTSLPQVRTGRNLFRYTQNWVRQ